MAWPRVYLWPSALRPDGDRPQARHVVEQLRADRLSSAGCIDADVGDHDAARRAARPGCSRCPGFRRKNVTVSSALIAVPEDPAGAPVDAARQIDRDHRHPGIVHRVDRLCRHALDRPVEAGAEQRVDDEVGSRRRRRRQGRRLTRASASAAIAASPVIRSRVAEQRDADLVAGLGQHARRHEAVAAVVARSRQHGNATARPAHGGGRPRRPPGRPLP